jgi:hypothetical protein
MSHRLTSKSLKQKGVTFSRWSLDANNEADETGQSPVDVPKSGFHKDITCLGDLDSNKSPTNCTQSTFIEM